MWHSPSPADNSVTLSLHWQLYEGDTERFTISFWGLQAKEYDQTGIFPTRSNWWRQIALLPSHNNNHQLSVFHLSLLLFETTCQHKVVQFGFKLLDHNPHSSPRLLVNKCLLLLLGDPYWELGSGRDSPWKQYIVGARYLCDGYLSWLIMITYLIA